MGELRLTPEQAALIPGFRDDWTRIGLEMSSADRGLAEQGVKQAYRAAGLDIPRIVWCSSPLAMALIRALVLCGVTPAQRRRIASAIKARVETTHWGSFWDGVLDAAEGFDAAAVGASLRDRLGHSVREDLRATLRRFVDDDSWNSVMEGLARPVRARVAAPIWAPVGRALWEGVGASAALGIWDAFRACTRDAICASLYGQHDAGWLGFFDYFNRVGGFDAAVQCLNGQVAVARAAGWWLPHERVCWISERPTRLMVDEGGALHASCGPALTYPDGWSLHAWRGTLVPRDWIERPETLTPRTALSHPKVEQRRAACEILGWDAVLSSLNARVVQQDPDPTIGQLLEVDLPDIGRERFLRVLCGTGRRFALPVPPGMTTALQANAWTYGLDPISFHPEVRT